MNRRISWVVGATAYVLPAAWAYVVQASLYGTARAQGRYICGLPMLAIITLACLGTATLSALALLFGWLSFRGLPKPRPRVRVAELAALAAPIVVGLSYAALLLTG